MKIVKAKFECLKSKMKVTKAKSEHRKAMISVKPSVC